MAGLQRPQRCTQLAGTSRLGPGTPRATALVWVGDSRSQAPDRQHSAGGADGLTGDPRVLDRSLVDLPVDPELARAILALELALARRDVAALPGGVEAILDDPFLEFGASGRQWDRDAMLEAFRDAPTAEVVIENFAAVALADDVVLASYQVRPGGSGRASLRSSVWVRRLGGWRIRFHQGTPISD
jgi:glyoxylase I family protein